MSKNEKTYKVTSPIKYNKKRYEVGDSILLDEETAEGLHVELADNPSGTEAEAKAKADAEKKAAEEKEAQAKAEAEKKAAEEKEAQAKAEAEKKAAEEKQTGKGKKSTSKKK